MCRVNTVFHTFYVKDRERNKVLNLLNDASLRDTLYSIYKIPATSEIYCKDLVYVQNPGQKFCSLGAKDWEIHCCQLSWCFLSAQLKILFVHC
jgi:hypothetical protein